MKSLVKIAGGGVAVVFAAIVIAAGMSGSDPVAPIVEPIPVTQASTSTDEKIIATSTPKVEVKATSSVAVPAPKPAPVSKPQPIQPVAQPAPKSEAPPKEEAQVTAGIYYTSSHYSADYFYCENDDGWKGLSPKYLQKFYSKEALLKSFPSRIQHQPC